MILQRMTADGLQKAKATLGHEYWRYFELDSSEWMEEVWGPGLFEPFREVPDFTLAPAAAYGAAEKGRLDIDNCIAVYDALRSAVTPAEASFEELWAGIANSNFYAYMRERWGYDRTTGVLRGKAREKAAGAVEARFFFSRNGNGIFRHTLAKCWWIAHLLYDSDRPGNRYWRLQALGPANFSTKATDIFVNYGYSRSRTVLDGVVRGVQRCREDGIPVDQAIEVLRPALRFLNAVGGSVILDALPPEQIADILLVGAKQAWENSGREQQAKAELPEAGRQQARRSE